MGKSDLTRKIKPPTETYTCNRCQKPFETPDRKRIHTCPKCSKINDGIRTPRCEAQGSRTGDLQTVENLIKRDARKAGGE